jgi:hypothetical protein
MGLKGDPVARFLIKVVDGTRVVALTAASTVKLKLEVAVAPFWSVAVTMYVVVEEALLAVPEITPLDAMLRPAGSPGLTTRTNVPSPPEAVTGAKDGYMCPCVIVVFATTVVAAIDESTARLKLAVPVAPSRSVTVTVKEVCAREEVEVPEISPVEFIVNPPGRVGLTVKLKVPLPPAAVTGVKAAVT